LADAEIIMTARMRWAAAQPGCSTTYHPLKTLAGDMLQSFKTSVRWQDSFSKVRSPAINHRFRLPTAAELAILRELWTCGEVTARDLHRALGKECYTTTLTHLSNLYKKRLAERFFDGRAHVYRAKVEKWIVLTAVARHVRDTLFERSGVALALCALSDTFPDRASMASLKGVIRDNERRTRLARHETTTRPAVSNRR